MHVRNTHVQKFTQTTLLGHFFTQTTLKVSIFPHMLLPLGRCGTCFASEDLGEDATG